MSAVRRLLGASVLGFCLLGVACDFGIRLSGTPPTYAGANSAKPPVSSASAAPAAPDALGPRPTLAAPSPFEPKPPTMFQGPGGINVWLVERPELPVVSAAFIVPYGSASDPEDRPGTMALLADMLDEGAVPRGALELSETMAMLGATLSLGAGLDGSSASVLSLRSKFDTTFEILCDVVARPRLAQPDFARVKKLWKNALKKRSDDPMSVAGVVSSAILYGPKTPYGHPSAGLFSKADAADLGTLKAIYARTWRPDRAVLVVVGQISKKELEAALEKQLASWKVKGDALPAPKLTKVEPTRPRFVVVDRPAAVQTVIYAAREGVTASDERAPGLSLINDALGGSFTSRLNLNLREEKGWTYGVGSGFNTTRGEGAFLVRTSVDAVHTGESVSEILRELSQMSEQGLSDEEVGKVKAQDRASLVETYEGVSGTGGRLAQLATAGLPPAFDAAASRIRQSATAADLARLARVHVAPNKLTIVLVGDRELIQRQLSEQGLEAPVVYGTEGQPLEKK